MPAPAPIEVPSIVKGSKPETKLAKMRAVNPDIPVVDLIDRLLVEEKITDKAAAKLREANTAAPVDPIATEPAEPPEGPAPEADPEETPTAPETPATAAEKLPRAGSALDGALQILKEAHEPLRPADILAAMKERNLAAGLKGKTPEATLAAQLCVAMKNQKFGLHRPERGKYAIKA